MSAESIQFGTGPEEPQRLAMCDWFQRHGIDPKWIPMDAIITRQLLPEPPGIEYDQYVLDDEGNLVLDARALESGPDVERETLWFPMEANPSPFPDEVLRECWRRAGTRETLGGTYVHMVVHP